MKIRLYGLKPKDEHLRSMLRNMVSNHIWTLKHEYSNVRAKVIYSNAGNIKGIVCTETGKTKVICIIDLEPKFCFTESEAQR